MQNYECLLITRPDGTQLKFGKECTADVTNNPSGQLPQLFLNPEKGRKLDAIRIINMISELGFVLDENGKKAKKKDIFEAFGGVLHTDFSNFSNDLSSSLADGSSMKKHLKIFEEMLEKMKDIFNHH